ncbi:MAG: xanthine dehydrogenase accessory protein XdhC [Paraglaciecola chathamensis]
MNTNKWYDALHQCQAQGKGYVLVTVLAAAGSTPRGNGTKMIVTGDETFDTIGGGHLEFAATEQARSLLAANEHTQHIEHYPLSSKLGQCCGGAVNLLFEVMIEQCQTVQIYGAGHVAHALVPLLAQLPLQIQWIDSRADLLPQNDAKFNVANVEMIVSDEPSEHISCAPANSWLVIMTHNHQLDYELVETALKRPDLPFIGMIGSDTKAKRFSTRIATRMPDADSPERFVSPIGVLDIPGKRPIEVAVSIAGQLIQRMNQHDAANQKSVATTPSSQSIERNNAHRNAQKDTDKTTQKNQAKREKQVRAWRASKELKDLL